ncbi:hypothetical protein Tco_0715487 [Tanacetum coccineum]
MQTRSSSKFVGEPSTNPTSTIPKRRNRRRSIQRVEPFSLVETPVVTMADQRTMAELLRAPTEGYAEAIVVPPIPAEHFELKHSLINLVTSKQFFGFEKEDPHAHIRYFNKITSTLKYKDVPETSIKLMLFPFSIDGPAQIWLDKEPPILCFFDQFQPLQFPVIHQPPQEMSIQDMEDLKQQYLDEMKNEMTEDEDEHLDTTLEMESDEENKSSVEDPNLTPSESEDLFEDLSNIERSVMCPVTFERKISNLFNPLFVKEIISTKIDPHHFNAESDLIESLLNQDTSLVSSPKFDSLLKDDSLMEEIDIFLTPDDSMPPGMENDDYDSKGDILFLKELLSNDSPSLPENGSFHFDVPSSPRPPVKPSDDGIYFEPDTGLLTAKVVGDISKHYVLMPRVLPTQPTVCLVIDTLRLFYPKMRTKIAPDYEDPRARGFVHRSLNLQSMLLGVRYP